MIQPSAISWSASFHLRARVLPITTICRLTRRPLAYGLGRRRGSGVIWAAKPNTAQDTPAFRSAGQASSPSRLHQRGPANNIAPLAAKFKQWSLRSQQKEPPHVPDSKTASSSAKIRQLQQLTDYASVVDPKGGSRFFRNAANQDSKCLPVQQPAIRKSKLPASNTAEAQQLRHHPSSTAALLSPDITASRIWQHLYRPTFLVFASAHVMATVCAVTDVASSPPWMPPTVGAAVGILFAALNRYGVVRWWRAPTAPLRVVITGSSKGIGKALAREFLRVGDHVIVAARSGHSVRTTVAELRAEMGPLIRITGTDVDVSSPASVARLANAAPVYFGGAVDVWINNAGYSGSFQPLVEATAAQVQEVVCTNMLGTLLATRAAILAMETQGTAGHIFNVDGAGANGAPTPNYAAYGATKAGVAHLMASVSAELEAAGSITAVHTVSPGMVLTGLLLSGATAANKRAFNILCEQPETIAAYLVPRMRTVVARGDKKRYIRYLTPARALWFLLMAPLRMRRFFDWEGRQLYEDEWSRLFGPLRKRTERLTAAAAQRTSTLGLAYSLSMTAAFLLIASASAVDTLPPL